MTASNATNPSVNTRKSLLLAWAIGLLAVLVACSGVILRLATGATDKHRNLYIYNRVILIPNYFNVGFMRRGLGGTILALLGGGSGPTGLAAFHVFGAVFLGVPLALLLRRLAAHGGRQWLYLGAVLVLSPQLMLAWSIDPGKGDMLNCGFVAWALLAALDRRFLLAAAILFVGSQVHETVVFLGVGLLAAIWYLQWRTGDATVRQAVAAVVLLGVLLVLSVLLQHAFGPQPHDIIRVINRQEPPSDLRDLAAYMTAGGAKTLATSACLSFARPSATLTLVAGFLVVLAYIVVLQIKGGTALMVFAVAAVLPLIALSAVAIDYGRWVCMAVMNAWLAAVALRLLGKSVVITARQYVVAIVFGLVLLMMGPTQIYFANSAVRWVAQRIWSPDTENLVVGRCDPAWRTLIDAPSAGINAS